MDKATKESALEKLSLEKLTLEKPAPEKPAAEEPSPPQKPAPTPEGDSGRNPNEASKRAAKAGVASEPAPAPPAPPARKPTKAERPPKPAAKPSISSNKLLLSIPRLGIEDLAVGDSPAQSYLDQEGIMHLSETGFPYKRGSNTYIAGHAEGYSTSRVPHVFRDLGDLQQGDHVVLQDAAGKTYDYRIYERFVVNPYDTWVTKPVAGKKIVSLQTCFPTPTFNKRLVVRGKLVG